MTLTTILLICALLVAAIVIAATFANLIVGRSRPQPQSSRAKIIARNRKQHDELMREWNGRHTARGARAKELVEAFRAMDGTIYYTLKDAIQIARGRHIALEIALKGINYSNLKELIKLQKEVFEKIKSSKKIDQKDVEKAAQLNNEMTYRQTHLPEKAAILEAALILFYRHDENPYVLNPSMTTAKRRHAAADPELEAFFLKSAWVMLQKSIEAANSPDFKDLSASNLVSLLNETDKRRNRRHFGTSNARNTVAERTKTPAS